jgi:glycosyltransferase involved in cell wall biosynthesis
MKITIVSLYFPPRIGGVENIMFGLASEWHRKGHEVTVFTFTPGEESYEFPVIRTISLTRLFREVKNSDIFFEANISMRTGLIGLLFQRKWFVLHHLTYTHIQRWQEVVKNFLSRFSHNFAPSQFVANTLKGKCKVIPNFYNEEFRCIPEIVRTKDFVFVGRLVSDKGAEDILIALNLLQQQSQRYTCTIVGEGPEEKRLKEKVKEFGLENYVTFTGPLRGMDLVKMINAHKVQVVPSKWPEPYGVVVLEGLSCGCRMVCSDSGGLTEASNGFAIHYPCNDVNALAQAMHEAITKGALNETEVVKVNEYLKERRVEVILKRYLREFHV